ncbi:FIST signal transduction protein [Desulfonatronum parangueonense]
MQVRLDTQGNVESLARIGAELLADPAFKGLMVLGCDANMWAAEEVSPCLSGFDKPVFGGLFPQIIHEQKNYETGTLLVGLPVVPDVAVLHGLSDPEADFDEQVEAIADQWDDGDLKNETLVVYVDGLSRRIAELVGALFNCFGLERNFIGGGAGSLSFVQKPCLLTPQGLLADAAVIVRLPMRSGIGVTHGWQPISESMKVTESDRNLIKTLDWRPAFEVYRELVEPHGGRTFREDNFFDIAKCYPFGINKLDSEVVVRDPLMVGPDGGLICVGEVPAGSFVRLLSGSPDSLIEAAGRARELAEKALPGGSGQAAFFIDCISRVLYLGDRIQDELANAAGNRPLFGALTLGEIANSGKDYLEFYNKTSVLGLLE